MSKTKTNLPIGKRIVKVPEGMGTGYVQKTEPEPRIATGVRETTVPVPGDGVMRKLKPDFDWGGQFKNFTKLNAILARNGLAFTKVARHINPNATPAYTVRDRHNKTCTLITYLAVCAGHIVWYKYEGECAGGGQNHVFVNNVKMKLTCFLAKSDHEQDELLMGRKEIMGNDSRKAREKLAKMYPEKWDSISRGMTGMDEGY